MYRIPVTAAYQQLSASAAAHSTYIVSVTWAVVPSVILQLPEHFSYLNTLVSRPPLFFVLRFAFSIIHGSGRARKAGKAWSHSSHEWMRGEEPIFKYVTNKLQKRVSYRWRRVVLTTLMSWVQNCGRALKRMIQCVVFAVGPLPLTSFWCPPDITHMMDETRPSLFFLRSSASVYILNANRRTKNGGGLGTRLPSGPNVFR